jgi:hypothetical protein
MPNYSMDNGSDKDKVPDLLKAFGSAVGEFSQGEFRTKYAVSVGRSPIDKSNYRAQGLGGGYCAGVCLDWIRRVLLSRPERDERYLTYQYANLKSGRRTFDSKDTKRSTEASAARSRQNVQVQADAYALSNSLSWYKESETVSHLDPTEFKKETARMDVFFDKSRREAGREASSKHFSQLELVGSKMSTYASASQWMNELFGSLIAGGCVSYLGFNSGTTGMPSPSGSANTRLTTRDLSICSTRTSACIRTARRASQCDQGAVRYGGGPYAVLQHVLVGDRPASEGHDLRAPATRHGNGGARGRRRSRTRDDHAAASATDASAARAAAHESVGIASSGADDADVRTGRARADDPADYAETDGIFGRDTIRSVNDSVQPAATGQQHGAYAWCQPIRDRKTLRRAR